MHQLHRFGFATLMSCTLAACGSDASDGGTGSQTLLIDADIDATPEIFNARTANDFTTELRVRVTRAGAPVTTGDVVVTSDGGEVVLAYDAADGPGRWRGAQAGYHEVYRLDVTSGDDYVHGVQLDGPDLHVFTSPDGSAAVDATRPVIVTWAAEEEAESATLETKEMDPLSILDTGSFEIPVGGLKSKETETEQEELRLVRLARQSPAGAVAGSQLSVRIENRLQLLVAPTAP